MFLVMVGLLAGLLGKSPTTTTCKEESTTASPLQTTTTPFESTPNPSNPWNNPRLPPNLVPLHYDVNLMLSLEPDSSGLYWFDGNNAATFQVLTSTNVILIHANRMIISNLSVINEKVRTLERKSMGYCC